MAIQGRLSFLLLAGLAAARLLVIVLAVENRGLSKPGQGPIAFDTHHAIL